MAFKDNHRRTYGRIFAAYNGVGPYNCGWCHGIITLEELAAYPSKIHIDHWDQDHFNNTPTNLRVMHVGCHSKKGYVHSKNWVLFGVPLDGSREYLDSVDRPPPINNEYKKKDGEKQNKGILFLAAHGVGPHKCEECGVDISLDELTAYPSKTIIPSAEEVLHKSCFARRLIRLAPEAASERGRRGGTSEKWDRPEYREIRRQNALKIPLEVRQKVGRYIAQLAADRGHVVSKYRQECSCGMVSTPGAMGKHFKNTGHAKGRLIPPESAERV